MMWGQWKIVEAYDWDEKDQSYRKRRDVSEPVWFSVWEANPMPPRDNLPDNHYWQRTYAESVYSKDRPVSS